jgi:adenylate kinase
MEGQPVRLLLIGAPGSGKGTQADLLSAHFGVPHISSGQILRDQMTRGTAAGLQAAAYVDAGDLVPDELVEETLREPVRVAAQHGGYILDGFPRTLLQAQHVQLDPQGSDFAVQAAVHLDVAHDELVRRLLARARGVDDSRAVIEHRLEVFEKHTRPMLEFFEQRGELVTVDAACPVDEVTATLVKQLEAARVAKSSS